MSGDPLTGPQAVRPAEVGADGDHLQVLGVLHDFMRRLHSQEDLEPLLEDIIRGVRDVLGFGIVILNLVRHDGTYHVAAIAAPDDLEKPLMGHVYPADFWDQFFDIAEDWGVLKFVPGELVGDVDDPGIFVPDIVHDPERPESWHPGNLLMAPLMDASGDMVGVLSVDIPPGLVVPSEELRQLLAIFAVQAGLAIRHVQRRQELRDAVRFEKAIRRFGALVHNLNSDRIQDECIPEVVRTLQAERVLMRVFREGDEPDRLTGWPDASTADGVEVVQAVRRLIEDNWQELTKAGLVGDAGELLDRAPRGLNPHLDALADSGRLRGSLFVPIGLEGAPLGYLLIQREGGWSRHEHDYAVAVSQLLGRGLANARVFARERELVDELTALDGYKQQLIAALSHELRNPLAAIAGHVELLEDAEDAADVRFSRDSIARAARRMSTLVDEMLDLLKVRDANREFIPEPLDLADLIEATVSMLRGRLTQDHIDLRMVPPPAPVVVLGESEELERVVINLLSNAVKYTQAGGGVRIEWGSDADAGEGWLRVSDNGLGISGEDQARLFEEFFRSTNPTALAKPGTGLGLSIVTRIVERHQGRVEVSSELGRGSSFTVWLPTAD